MHIPVLLKEVIEYLSPQPNQNFIDCTINGGGHSFEILKHTAPNGKILGIDLDERLIKNLELQIRHQELGKRLILVHDNFANLKEIVLKNNFQPVNGVLLDLGMSSEQIEQSGKGFSFLRDEPLDMRFSPEKNDLTAETIINKWPEGELVKTFREYGEERFANRIARQIIRERKIKKIETTFQLAEIIRKAIPSKFWHGRIHFATRVFQAFRIAVNDELNNLRKVLPQILEVMSPGGKSVVISFHSLEDRIVKIFIKEQIKLGKIRSLFKKPIMAGPEEIERNSRSRSAKLRVFEVNL